MQELSQPLHASPRINTLLSQITQETPTLTTSLLTSLKKHIKVKTETLKQQIRTFESKWDMTFEEFSERTKTGTLLQKPRSTDVEGDFKTWEQTEQLLKHYESLRVQ